MSRTKLPRLARTAAVALFVAAASARFALAQNPIADENALFESPQSQWDVSGAGDASIQGFADDIIHAADDNVTFRVDTPAADDRIDVYRLGWYAGLGARLVASLAKLVREDPEDGRASHVIPVVRDDTRAAEILVQTSDTTWQACNACGGNSLYTGSPAGRAYAVSFNRPFTTRGGTPEDWVFDAEYPLVRWLERSGYDVSHASGADSDRSGAEPLEHEIFVSIGHDEYRSGAQRTNVEAARAAGVHLVCSGAIEVPAAGGALRFWRNTSVTALAPNTLATLPADPLGYEWDEDLDNGARPAGAMRLSSTALNVPERSLDFGSSYGPGTATHHLRPYRHASGALVFGAGTVQRAWELDGGPPSVRKLSEFHRPSRLCEIGLRAIRDLNGRGGCPAYEARFGVRSEAAA